VRRREFIALLGGAAAAWPLAVRAQQSERIRRIGALSPRADDPEARALLAAFLQGLAQLGWLEGRNVRIDARWGAGDSDRIRRYAAELVALAPDVILATATATVAPLQQATRTVPIVFASVIDPVGAGFVASLARPGGNTTGFTIYEYGISGKWLEDPAIASGIGQFAAIQGAAPPFGVEVTPVNVHDAAEIERDIAEFARMSNGGLIVTGATRVNINRDLIIALAARHRLPAVYSDRALVVRGGLMSYGPDRVDSHRRAAAYVDRILKGEKPADLPVQAPTKYELVINMKTAKALGLTIPPGLLAIADEVIE
jgi:ABC-type uncharacterized transport system substrate-binding protein